MNPLNKLSALAALIAFSASAAEPAPPAAAPCIAVRIGDRQAQALDCLNAALVLAVQRQVDQRALAQAVTEVNPLAAAPTRLGLYNQAETRQRLGSNFGISARPQRPSRTYSNPVLQKRP